MIKLLVIFCLAVIISCQSDKILSLPLFDGNLGNQYSGYFEVPGSANAIRRFHYWFVESTGNPATDPLVLWLNGGPGCSSLDGYFYEHGPLHFSQDPNSPLKLVENPYTWTKYASVIYLESPAGVGFSYSSSPQDYLNQNDSTTATSNYAFIKSFYERYPQFKSNDFYIAGESYAGVYVPTLADLVLDGILKKTYHIPFKGIMVGNGVTNAVSVTELNSYLSFLHGHGIISNSLWEKIVAECVPRPNSDLCNQLSGEAYANFNDINMYNIYGDCYNQRPLESHILQNSNAKLNPPCIDANYGTLYLNMPSVKAALHVPSTITWSICSGVVNNGYSRTPNSMVPIHQKLIKNNIRVLIYSGDNDFAVPYTDSETWTSTDMGLIAKSDWRQWFYNDNEGQQVGGFVTEYPFDFTFITVRGAGHMVPQYRPQAALAMFTRFLKNQPM